MGQRDLWGQVEKRGAEYYPYFPPISLNLDRLPPYGMLCISEGSYPSYSRAFDISVSCRESSWDQGRHWSYCIVDWRPTAWWRVDVPCAWEMGERQCSRIDPNEWDTWFGLDHMNQLRRHKIWPPLKPINVCIMSHLNVSSWKKWGRKMPKRGNTFWHLPYSKSTLLETAIKPIDRLLFPRALTQLTIKYGVADQFCPKVYIICILCTHPIISLSSVQPSIHQTLAFFFGQAS